MHLCIIMRLLVLGIPLMLKCLKISNASNEHNISFKTFDASYVLTNKSGKVVAKYVGDCWGPSASEGPQKHDLTMFLEYNT
jgi:hypothetical protein